jgi:prefoldin subunit 5
MPKHEAAIISEARRVASLERKQRDLKRTLKEVAAELRQARKNLKALATAPRPDPFEQTPPMRLFGEK